MKTIAFLFALCIAAVGVLGLVSPGLLAAIGARFVVSGAFYALAAVRIAFGLLLVRVSPISRAPRTLRLVGWAIVVLGVLALLAGAFAIGPARESLEAWMRQGPVVARLTALFPLALGGFIAWACAPSRGASARR
jgi:hypothetical protein